MQYTLFPNKVSTKKIQLDDGVCRIESNMDWFSLVIAETDSVCTVHYSRAVCLIVHCGMLSSYVDRGCCRRCGDLSGTLRGTAGTLPAGHFYIVSLTCSELSSFLCFQYFLCFHVLI